jgi:type IV secretory pathway VirD2 relaxase
VLGEYRSNFNDLICRSRGSQPEEGVSMRDEEFEPQLGRVRAAGKSRARKYLGRVTAAATRAGKAGAARSNQFDGSRIGRGASMGRLLSSRDRHGGLRARRAIVKTRLVRLAGKGQPAARAHLRYIQRDGVTREGAPGALYGPDVDGADGKAFLERSADDRHQFRFIVSAEDGADYPDLKPFIRRLMNQVEEDLGSGLDWVAVDHFNTGHPHTHIMLRGVDERGQNLVIAREYISHGLRERAAELVTLDLGPRTDQEIEARLRHDVDEERLTAIDRRLFRSMDADRTVGQGDRDPLYQALRAGRLQILKRLGLAEELDGGRWQLSDGLENTLRALGERGDIIRTMQREMTARGIEREGVGTRIHAGPEPGAVAIVGKVIMRGLADEHRDRHFLLVDGIDGEVHYVALGKGEGVEPTAEGSIVRITPSNGGSRDVDRTIERIARDNGGLYSIDAHLRHDRSASEAFAETHVRRLEAMRRRASVVERLADGRWRIADDHLDRIAAYERRLAEDRPVDVHLVSPVRIEPLARMNAATWIDRRLVEGQSDPARDLGFGREVRDAEARRRQWLIEEGLASEQGGQIRYAPNLLDQLRRRELLRIAGKLSDELGLDFVEAQQGERIEGVLKRIVEMVSGRHALIERAHDFTLVPWRPMLERQIDKPVSGVMRGSGASWTIGRERSGPSIG